VHEYDLIAEWYAADRDRRTGVPETLALASSIERGGRVLDMGCGNGVPITRTLLGAGHQVVGLDSASQMLARFRLNLPHTPAVRGTIQACAFAADSFDAAVAWGVMFHLTHDDQVKAIASVSRVLRSGAPFLFTSGDAANDDRGWIEGTMDGVTFRYYSFGADTYRRILAEHGLSLVDVHTDAGQNLYYLARKWP
jgi:ubiquinone/menaquinone biosynthesis C-methylase UbiE